MKYFVYIVAIFATLFWLQMWMTDFLNAKLNPYARNDNDKMDDIKRTKVKIWLLVIISMFWAAVI